jgi:hypothetical protein
MDAARGPPVALPTPSEVAPVSMAPPEDPTIRHADRPKDGPQPEPAAPSVSAWPLLRAALKGLLWLAFLSSALLVVRAVATPALPALRSLASALSDVVAHPFTAAPPAPLPDEDPALTLAAGPARHASLPRMALVWVVLAVSASGLFGFYRKAITGVFLQWALWALCIVGFPYSLAVLLLDASVDVWARATELFAEALPTPMVACLAGSCVAAACACWACVWCVCYRSPPVAKAAPPLQPGHSVHPVPAAASLAEAPAPAVAAVSPPLATVTGCPPAEQASSLTAEVFKAQLDAMQATLQQWKQSQDEHFVALENAQRELRLLIPSQSEWNRLLRSSKRATEFLKGLRRVPSDEEEPSAAVNLVCSDQALRTDVGDAALDSQAEDLPEGSDSSDSDEDPEGQARRPRKSKRVSIHDPAQVRVLQTQHRRKRQPPATPLTDKHRAAIASATSESETVQELKDRIRRLEARQTERRSVGLTPEEQQMTLRQLEAHWAHERRVKRYGEAPDRPLTSEERQMPHSELRRRFSVESNLRWAQRQAESGHTPILCSTCGRYRQEGDDHFCGRAPWVSPTQYRSGVPTHQEVVITGTSRGFNVQRQTTMDPDEVQRALRNLEKAQADFQALTRPAPPEAPSPVASTPLPRPPPAVEAAPAPQPVTPPPSAAPAPNATLVVRLEQSQPRIPRKSERDRDDPPAKRQRSNGRSKRPDPPEDAETRAQVNALLSAGHLDCLFPKGGRPALLRA